MRHFYRYIQPGITFLLLTGLAPIQGCGHHELLIDVLRPYVMERKFDEIALRQVEEYKKTGKFSSPMKMDVSCYNAYSRFSPTNDAVINFAIKSASCDLEDADTHVVNYMSKLFVLPNAPQSNSKIVEVQCGKPGYPVAEFSNESFAPRLARGIFPECPPIAGTGRILPMYRDYSLPRKRQVLAGQEKVIQELDRISNQQVQEFTKTGQYSSALSFNPECGQYVSSLLDDGKTVVNWILPKYYCNSNSLDQNDELAADYTDQYEFVSAVFAVENKQQRTVTLSRIVCEIRIGNAPDIVKHPPRLVNGAPACSVDSKSTVNSSSVKKILTKQYLPVPTR
jgi:hypothetical protein